MANSHSKKTRPSHVGILRDDILVILNGGYRDKEKIIKWFQDYKATDYPDRPITRQYLEMKEKAKQLNIKIT